MGRGLHRVALQTRGTGGAGREVVARSQTRDTGPNGTRVGVRGAQRGKTWSWVRLWAVFRTPQPVGSGGAWGPSSGCQDCGSSLGGEEGAA